jgi:acyl-CoA synthetase (AMP-forming)/AMP-acid ligase II
MTIEALGAAELCNVYGSTETYGNCAVTDADDPLALRLHSQGLPLPGMTIRAVDLATRRPLPVRRARQRLPSIGEVEPEAVRIAIRPIPATNCLPSDRCRGLPATISPSPIAA